jgi:hypothetical protein
VLIISFTFWGALQLTAGYLDDVFELEDPETAEAYLLQAAFANRYAAIEIKEGKVTDEGLSSTIYQIGGPGKVKVHFDSSALFEKFDGEPRIIDAASGEVALDRFERLRKVIPLQDHVQEITVSGRTKDGIPVTANGIKVKYHINRGDAAQTLDTPYPYSKDSVENLIYNQTISKPIPTKTEEFDPPSDKHYIHLKTEHREIFNLKPGILSGKIGGFIRTRNLSEFLATTSLPEEEIQSADKKKIEDTARRIQSDLEELDQDQQTSSTDEDSKFEKPEQQNQEKTKKADKQPSPSFFHRTEISQNIKEDTNIAREYTGLEIEWLDIGTWEMPEIAKAITEQHREAWKLSLKNLGQKNPKATKKIEEEAKIKALREILMSLIFIVQSEDAYEKPEPAIKKMLILYHQNLIQVSEIYRNRGIPRPAPIQNVISLLGVILEKFRYIN